MSPPKKRYKIPQVNTEKTAKKILSLDDAYRNEDKLTFRFEYLDRSHNLFNLGNTENSWFLSFIDWLKEVSNQRAIDLKGGKYEFHPVDWRNANASPPADPDQYEYWQIRLNKSTGRVIGIRRENDFYVVWIDPHHHLTDSEGYGKAQYYYAQKTDYEIVCEQKEYFEGRCRGLEQQVQDYEEVMEQTCSECEHRQLALAT